MLRGSWGRNMDNSEIISNEGNNTDGTSFPYNVRNKGAVQTFRVGSRSLPLYPSVILCLGLLNVILLLTAIAIGIYCGKVNQESEPHNHKTAQGLLIEVNELQRAQGEAVKDKEVSEQALEQERSNAKQLELHLTHNKTNSDRLQRQLEVLHVEKATILANSSESKKSCGRCLPGWILLNTTCYFYSTSTSLPQRNWMESRADCISRGADLVVIDSWEEQVILFESLPKLSPYARAPRFWIGLTDHHEEGTWLWVNNATVLDGGYWMEKQNPGNSTDCGAFMRTHVDDPRKSWFDESCQETRAWLCEI